jgi:uncharacterized protein with von Willebrand factor type A (vWA) domain
MKYRYGEFDGQPFQSPDDLFARSNVMKFILQHGQQALEAMDELSGDEEKEFVQQMITAGLLERDEQSGELRLTPRMLAALENRALLEIFRGLRQGTREGHATTDRGRGDERTDGTRPYEFGDPLSELDLGQTMRNAMTRAARDQQGQPRLPLRVGQHDFELHQTEGVSDVATCVLLDQSGSMMRWGRFYHAKSVALGMRGLIRRHFPLDTIDFVGFYSLAERLKEQDLPLIMPKPISVHDHQVRLRMPLKQAQAQPQRVPQHFTNLQLGLRIARGLLARRGAANKQIFIITDGQPTAHVEPGPGGDETLHLLYPPSERTTEHTLKEALRCHQMGIRIATFALIEDYWGMDWVSFVDQLTRLTRGTAFYCSSDDLSSTVIESYLQGRRRKSAIT